MRPAPAKVASQSLFDLFERWFRRSQQQRLGGHDHAVGAVAALGGLLGDESRLHRVRLCRSAETLERGDVATCGDAHRQRAGTRRRLVDEDRAGSALTEATPELRPVQRQWAAERVEERLRRIPAVDRDRAPIEPERVLGHVESPLKWLPPILPPPQRKPMHATAANAAITAPFTLRESSRARTIVPAT